MAKQKTRAKKQSLEKYRETLLDRRSFLIKDIREMEKTVAATPPKSPEDDKSFEREILFGLIESQEAAIRDIDKALRRIKDGTFGICSVCGKAINKKRLKAKPSSELCLKCRMKYEEEIYG